MGGLDRWFDGYNNQPIVWIDDPCTINTSFGQQTVQQLKCLISTGPMKCEIKGGNMTFDSLIIIITSNKNPRQCAREMGEDNE